MEKICETSKICRRYEAKAYEKSKCKVDIVQDGWDREWRLITGRVGKSMVWG